MVCCGCGELGWAPCLGLHCVGCVRALERTACPFLLRRLFAQPLSEPSLCALLRIPTLTCTLCAGDASRQMVAMVTKNLARVLWRGGHVEEAARDHYTALGTAGALKAQTSPAERAAAWRGAFAVMQVGSLAFRPTGAGEEREGYGWVVCGCKSVRHFIFMLSSTRILPRRRSDG